MKRRKFLTGLLGLTAIPLVGCIPLRKDKSKLMEANTPSWEEGTWTPVFDKHGNIVDGSYKGKCLWVGKDQEFKTVEEALEAAWQRLQANG